jgi:hypothetical protein
VNPIAGTGHRLRRGKYVEVAFVATEEVAVGAARDFGASFEQEGRATFGWTTVPSPRARSSHLLGARSDRVEIYLYHVMA